MTTAEIQMATPFTTTDLAGMAAFKRRNKRSGLKAVMQHDHAEFAAGVCEVTLPRGDGTIDFAAWRDGAGVHLDSVRTGKTRGPFTDLGGALRSLSGLRL